MYLKNFFLFFCILATQIIIGGQHYAYPIDNFAKAQIKSIMIYNKTKDTVLLTPVYGNDPFGNVRAGSLGPQQMTKFNYSCCLTSISFQAPNLPVQTFSFPSQPKNTSLIISNPNSTGLIITEAPAT